MRMDGLLKVSIVEQPDGLDRELHLEFTEVFRDLDQKAQYGAFKA